MCPRLILCVPVCPCVSLCDPVAKLETNSKVLPQRSVQQLSRVYEVMLEVNLETL